MLTAVQGKKLIEVAREVIKATLKGKSYTASSSLKRLFSFNAGCFVTLNINSQLRGCMGFTEPTKPLYEALVKAAENAAFHDPRFPPLDEAEFSSITIEVSVLTRPHMIMVRNPEEYIKEIKIGTDGLLVKGPYETGILLPQVAVEYNWDPREFISQTCVKAGMTADAWQDFNKCVVYKFQCQIFNEISKPVQVAQY